MTAPIVKLDQKLSRAADIGKGVRLEPADIDLLSSLGVFGILHEAKAKYLKEQGRCRHMERQSIVGGNTGSTGTGRPTVRSVPPISPSGGTTPTRDASEALQRARQKKDQRSSH